MTFADYYFAKARTKKISKSFGWIGIVSWFLGISIVFLFESDAKNILGIVVSGFFYSFLSLLFKKRTLVIKPK